VNGLNGLSGKTILITGATGSFGNEMVAELLKYENIKKIIIFSRDELKQWQMKQRFAGLDPRGALRFFIGDVRDINRLRRAFNDVDVVIHAAALKQVASCEYNPSEAIATNICGAQNVIDAAIDCGVKKVIALSTDKAAAPLNLYGATKLTSDRLFLSAGHYSKPSGTIFAVVRYGNVFGSRGSVVPLWIEQQRRGFITITDKSMTRFSLTLRAGVDFVLSTLKLMRGSELFVPKCDSYILGDMAKAMGEVEWRFIGKTVGEKMHEDLIVPGEGGTVLNCDTYFCVLRDTINASELGFYRDYAETNIEMMDPDFHYSSKQPINRLTVDQLKLGLDEFRKAIKPEDR
jgi:UDP-N-acetylglucosamine 4,6-dehydratase